VGDVYSSSEAGRETGLSGDTIRNVILEINKNGKSIDEIGETTKKRYNIVRKIKMPNCS
jgi:hypothetical protein